MIQFSTHMLVKVQLTSSNPSSRRLFALHLFLPSLAHLFTNFFHTYLRRLLGHSPLRADTTRTIHSVRWQWEVTNVPDNCLQQWSNATCVLIPRRLM